MDFFLDSADVKTIKKMYATGLVDGVTTNPSLIAKSGQNFFTVLKQISKTVKGPISAEVTATDSKNIVVKLPLTQEGLIACQHLTKIKIKTNVTLCFSSTQALIAARSGATYISPFVGRLDDINENGMELIKQIKTIYTNYQFKTKILVASVRNIDHVRESALIGADVVTIPPKIFEMLYEHPLTEKGLMDFLNDWKKTKQKIL